LPEHAAQPPLGCAAYSDPLPCRAGASGLPKPKVTSVRGRQSSASQGVCSGSLSVGIADSRCLIQLARLISFVLSDGLGTKSFDYRVAPAVAGSRNAVAMR
jgi:hypothetical protein